MPLILEIILGIVLIGLLVHIAAWLIAGRFIGRYKPDPARTPASIGLKFEKVIFPARDGVRLSGRLVTEVPKEIDKKAIIIFCSGLFGSMDGDTDLIPMFVEAGYGVLQFDWRAHGLSEGKTCTLGLREPEDVLGAIDFLELRGIKRVGVMGYSFGGTAALRAATLDHRPAAIAADGAFVRLGNAADGLLTERYGGARAALLRPLIGLVLVMAGLRLRDTLARAEPLETAAQISPRPVLLVYGQDDPIVPPEDQDDLFSACGDPKALWRADGAGHREIHTSQPEEYRQHVIEFFNTYLG